MRFERSFLISSLVLATLVVGCDGPPPAILERARADGHTAEIVALAYSPDGQTLVSRGADQIKVWDSSTLRELASIPSDESDFGALAVNPDGKTFAANLKGQGIVSWNLADGIEQANFRTNPASIALANEVAPEAFGWGLAYSPDGSILAGSAEDQGAKSSIFVWDLATHKATGLGPPATPATHLRFTPDGNSLVAKGMDGTIRVWDLASQLERTAITANTSYLASISVSPDGQTVASAGAERYLRFWSVASGKEVARFKGHLKAILGIAFHPNGRYVVTSDSGGSIFLWDIQSGQAIAQFKGHHGKVWAVAFRPDGKELATAGEDKRIRVWDVAQAITKYGH